eukprot:IDg10920t1
MVPPANLLHFDYVLSLLAARLSFRQILQVVLENRVILGCRSKTGCLSDGEDSYFSWIARPLFSLCCRLSLLGLLNLELSVRLRLRTLPMPLSLGIRLLLTFAHLIS